MNTFYEIYIRFMVWLGAAPPPTYQHLFQPQHSLVTKPILTSTKVESRSSFFHNLQKGIRTWRKILFNPDLQTLTEIKVETDSRTIWHWTLFAGAISGLINVLLFFLLSDIFIGWSAFFSPSSSISFGAVIFGSLTRGVIGAVGLFLFAYVLSQIFNGRAKARGGSGKVEEQNYLVAAFLVPYYLLLIIPLIGWPILLLILIWQFSSIARSVQVVYDLSFAQAKEVIQYPTKVLIIFYSLYYLLGLYSLYQGVFVFN